jgi:hypothetical protein
MPSSDVLFVNSCVQAVVVLVLMLVIFVVRKRVGARWVYLGFEALLLTILLRRIDEIGVRFGLDVFNQTAGSILSWIVIGTLLVAFLNVWRRRAEIKRVEAGLKAREEYLETLRRNAERLQSWDHQPTSRIV